MEDNRQIKKNAEQVYSALRSMKSATLERISRMCKLTTQDVLMALGWLACENKVTINGQTVKLVEIESQFYF